MSTAQVQNPVNARGQAAQPGTVASPTAVEKGVILFFVTFLLLLPKGGIKLAGVPITWGYLGLALFFLWLPLALLAGRRIELRKVRLLTLALLLPFQAVAWLGLVTNGIEGFGFAISLVVSLVFVPLMFVLVFGVHLDRLDLSYLFRLVRFGVLAVSVYGIFLFFYKLLTGSFIEIPFLTVNAGDVGELEDKYIDRAGVFKLISTYNNGNIYGICLLILLPLYVWIERSGVKQLIVKTSLLLTLSRTVWAGLIVFELVQRLYVRRVSPRTVVVLGTSLLLIAGGVWYALDLLGVDVGFLFDRTLGGRQEQWKNLELMTVLPSTEFEDIREMVYLSMLHNFGLLGLASFLLGMAAPLLLFASGSLPFAASGYKKSLAVGLFVYLFVSLSDGALLFIPVMAFYWFVVSLLLSDNPSFPRDPEEERERPRRRVGAGTLPLVVLDVRRPGAELEPARLGSIR
ncbi:MAG: hypothetical protein ACR2H9_02300 [Longimicrobiaceae bacterium]